MSASAKSCKHCRNLAESVRRRSRPGPHRLASGTNPPGSLILMTASQPHGTPRQAPQRALHAAAPGTLGRIPVLHVSPCVEQGAFPAKSVVDEPFEVTATVFRLS